MKTVAEPNEVVKTMEGKSLDTGPSKLAAWERVPVKNAAIAFSSFKRATHPPSRRDNFITRKHKGEMESPDCRSIARGSWPRAS